MSFLRRIVSIFALMALICCACAQAEETTTYAMNITGGCQMKVSADRTRALVDGDYTTAWLPDETDASITISLPPDGAGYLKIDWLDEPYKYSVVQYNAQKKKIVSLNQDEIFTSVTNIIRINVNTNYIVIRVSGKKQRISELTIYSKGALPPEEHMWQSPLKKCDMMVFSAHLGDELGCFGGVVPYFTGEKAVQLVYMTDGSRKMVGAALDALWSIGMHDYPLMLDLDRDAKGNVKSVVNKWGGQDALVGKLVACIRAGKPDVVVTHDLNGENGDKQHKVTAAAVKAAVEAAGDETKYTQSAKKYGVWKVKKLYTHLGDNAVEQDFGNGPAQARTAMSGYMGGYSEKDTRGDDALYTLTYSTVGEDELGGGFFQNVSYVRKTPEPTEVPDLDSTNAPTREPAILFGTDSPEVSTAPTEKAVLTEDSGFGSALKTMGIVIGGGIGVMLLVTGLQAIMYMLRKRRRRRFY